MRKYLLFAGLIGLVFQSSRVFAGGILSIPETFQEKSQWCWAGCSHAVLYYYGKDFTQTAIAQYGTLGINTWNWLWGETPADNPNVGDPPRKGIDMILGYFGGISSSGVAYAISKSDADVEITAGRPFVIRWGWTTGGGHFIVGRGIYGDTIHYMDPLPGNGYALALYDWVLANADHSWTHTLKITTNAPPDISINPDTLRFVWNNAKSMEKSFYDTVKTMTVYNNGYSDLDVTYIGNGHPWVESVNPDNFTVTSGDSQSVTITVTSAGLGVGNYRDTIIIYSNDPYDSLYFEPIVFSVDTTAVEEISNIKNQISKLEIGENPVRNNTVIHYSLPFTVGDLRIAVFDLSGREVATLVSGEKEAGNHVLRWNAKDLKTGIYFVTLSAGNYKETRKLILVK